MKFSSPNDMKLKQKKKNAHKILKLHVILQSELIYSNRYVLGIFMHTNTLIYIFSQCNISSFRGIRGREKELINYQGEVALFRICSHQFFLINLKIIGIGFDFWFFSPSPSLSCHPSEGRSIAITWLKNWL